ncbi:B3/B4 domain-containing protein [Aminipila luticellarii]|uniref:B3/B4 tRNA-binding domain-containing protein n=1 Tax=Aminipila luticellarii TaxID=2507160 RepID=A0A410PTQ5_9FIRM|nr:phenylalanine--tRNA ligase beta subunit-related protein [Aminipila luticellarii]QAT42351.1 hypothetical protein EQM06_03390 [Aminipila luticellarii]
MNFILNESLVNLGIHDIVIAVVEGTDSSVTLPDKILELLKSREERALALQPDELDENPVIAGYRNLVQKIGRSAKKNPPTAESLIKNIQRRGSMPRINTIVDIYNTETLQSYLSIGAHDLDKIEFPIEFTVSHREDIFYPIMAPEKKVADYDFIYRDQKGILAYLDCRDSELYKIEENTTKVLFVIQGNQNTSVEYRKNALERICESLKEITPGLTYKIQVIC